ncbi:hypothetical protein BKA93DRAFT_455009 [Sparassis latifolia]
MDLYPLIYLWCGAAFVSGFHMKLHYGRVEQAQPTTFRDLMQGKKAVIENQFVLAMTLRTDVVPFAPMDKLQVLGAVGRQLEHLLDLASAQLYGSVDVLMHTLG